MIATATKRITVSPKFICLDNRVTFGFSATVEGVEDPEVRWSIHSGLGSINPTTGVYTAPPVGETEDVVVAEVVGEEDLEDSAIVRVGPCLCHFDIDVGGNSVWSVPGPTSPFTGSTTTESAPCSVFVMPDGPDGEPRFRATSPPLWLGGRGAIRLLPSWGGNQVNAAYQSPFNEAWITNQTDDDAGVTLTVEEFADGFMEGRLNGTAVQREDPEDPDRITSTVLVSVTFRAGRFDGPGPCR